MAYKQSPGRSPFPKTGRDIPLNFLSPLHNREKGHKGDTGKNALGANISEADIMNSDLGKESSRLTKGIKSEMGIVGHTKAQTDAKKKELSYQVSKTSGMRRHGEKGLRIDQGDVGKIRKETAGTSYDINKNPRIKQLENEIQKGGKGIPVDYK